MRSEYNFLLKVGGNNLMGGHDFYYSSLIMSTLPNYMLVFFLKKKLNLSILGICFLVVLRVHWSLKLVDSVAATLLAVINTQNASKIGAFYTMIICCYLLYAILALLAIHVVLDSDNMLYLLAFNLVGWYESLGTVT